jgi:hypothetical protein
VRCARCGNENSEGNRFCGMCGATLLMAAPPVASAPAQASPTQTAAMRPTLIPSTAPSAPATPRTPTTGPVPTSASDDAPVISGPSFLGLNQPEPEPARRQRGNLSIDPNSAPASSNLDYLLRDDEEEVKRGGVGKYVLILLALVLAAGLGYFLWKNRGFGQASEISKPVQNSDAPDTSATASQPSNPSTLNPSTPNPSTTGASSPNTSASEATPSPAPSPSSAPAQPLTGPASSAGSSGAAATTTPNPTNVITAADAPPSGTATPTPNSPAEATTPPPVSGAKPAAPSTSAPAEPKPTPSRAAAAPPPRSKPSPVIKPLQAVNQVSEAQKYLYGRGVGQDCDRGMRLLKPAADRADPRAMVEMGALYSAGLCTPHDLPTAYRWFAQALRKDPDNRSVQTDLEKLWGEMTQPERQLAIKLSQ